MGVMTLEDFQSELNFTLSRRNDADAVLATRTARWINQAYVYMCHPSVHHFREIQSISEITLATGTNEYAIVTEDSNTVIAVRFVTFVDATTVTNTSTKRKVRPRGIRQFEQKTLTTGPPTEYAVDGSTLFISPIPRSNENGKKLRIGYYQEPDLLTGTDVTVLPYYYDRPLLKLAQAFAEDDLQDRELSMLTLRMATALLNNAESETQLEGEETDFQVEIVSQSVM